MFTGLVKTIGEIRRVDQRGDRLFVIAMDEAFAIEIGDSVACSGICLTVVKINGHEFKVSASDETLRCTNAGEWKVGTRLNLEPALKVGDSLGGHFVSGHVDGIARAIANAPEGDSMKWGFEVPAAFAKFIAPKGSVTLDGVSLTVNDVINNRFSVNIIPHTQKATCFGDMKVGDAVNFEVDLLARYMARLKEQV